MSSFATEFSRGLSSRHFFPKFDNLKVEKGDPLSILTESDVLLVTKKHSGKQILNHASFLNVRKLRPNQSSFCFPTQAPSSYCTEYT